MNNLDSDPGAFRSHIFLTHIRNIIAKPVIKFLSFINNLVLKITNNVGIDNREKVSEEEIKSLILRSQENGCIEKDEKQMIYGIFEFNDKLVREIMTPRNDMFAIDIEDDIDDILDGVLKSSYSRIPVYKSNIDNIIGILYVKDLLIEARRVGFKNINLVEILHEPYFVPETKRTNELFKILKAKKVHLALLFDEYGGIAGLVTMEDLVEEVMGEIEDEYDIEELLIRPIDDNSFIVKGSLTVSEFNNKFDIDIEEGDYDTINGYLLTLLGHIPKENEVVELHDTMFTIIKVDNRRIEEIKVNLNNSYIAS